MGGSQHSSPHKPSPKGSGLIWWLVLRWAHLAFPTVPCAYNLTFWPFLLRLSFFYEFISPCYCVAGGRRWIFYFQSIADTMNVASVTIKLFVFASHLCIDVYFCSLVHSTTICCTFNTFYGDIWSTFTSDFKDMFSFAQYISVLYTLLYLLSIIMHNSDPVLDLLSIDRTV